MKNYKQILEAVHRGIKLALDDYQDIEPNSSISQTNDIIDNDNEMEKIIFLRKNFVNMGFPSGTWWAKYNLGYTTNSTDLYGDYYAWGELKPQKEEYTWNSYEFSSQALNSAYYHMTKYNNDDNLRILEDYDDIVTQLYGDHYTIPTKEQFEELIKYTTQKWVKSYKNFDIEGKLFISNINGNEIFFPAGGDVQDNEPGGKNEYGCYWSKNSVEGLTDADAIDLYFEEKICEICKDGRRFGYNIRAVYNK